MIKGIIFDECLNTAADWGAIFKKAFPSDGVLCGMQAAMGSGGFELAPGYFILCGRVLQNDGTLKIANDSGVKNGYVRLVYRIDLSAEAKEQPFTQGAVRLESSGGEVFPSLVREDINTGGQVYEAELAVFELAEGAPVRLVRQMRPAGMDELYIYSGNEQSGGHVALRHLSDGGVGVFHRPEGGSEIQALSMDASGGVVVHGGFCIDGTLAVGGSIDQAAGQSARLGRELLLRADEKNQMRMGYDEQDGGVEFSITSDGKEYVRAIGIRGDGTVDVPIPAPSIEDDLSINGDLILKSRDKAVRCGSTKLTWADKDGKLWVGSTRTGEDAQQAAVAATDHVALMTLQPGQGFTEALRADGTHIKMGRNLDVDGRLSVEGDTELKGDLSVVGELELERVKLTGDFTVPGKTTLGNLVVDSPDQMAAVFKSGVRLEGGLSLSGGSIELGTTGSGVTAAGKQLLYLDVSGDGWLGSDDLTKAPALIQLSARDRVQVKSPLVLEQNLSVADYSKTADFGYEMAVNGAASNRFSIRYQNAGRQNTVGMYARTGTSEYPVVNIDGTSGDVYMVREVSVPSLVIRGTDLHSKSPSPMRILSDGGLRVRNQYNSIYAPVVASYFETAGYRMGGGGAGLEISWQNKPALRIKADDGHLQLPQTGTTTAAANVYMTAQKTLLMTSSSQKYKTNIQAADIDQMAAVLRKLPIRSYTSLCEADDPDVVHIGGIAEEFYRVDPRFAVVEEDADGGRPEVRNIEERALLYSAVAGWQQHDRRLRKMEQQLKKMEA